MRAEAAPTRAADPVTALLRSPAVRSATPAVRQWLAAILRHGARGNGKPPAGSVKTDAKRS
jgi:hypothetical protein